eukprot:scaffold3844_cov105-Cylindrotheca_fusiformis.AAC.5
MSDDKLACVWLRMCATAERQYWKNLHDSSRTSKRFLSNLEITNETYEEMTTKCFAKNVATTPSCRTVCIARIRMTHLGH